MTDDVFYFLKRIVLLKPDCDELHPITVLIVSTRAEWRLLQVKPNGISVHVPDVEVQ
jgi:hypothetical protein